MLALSLRTITPLARTPAARRIPTSLVSSLCRSTARRALRNSALAFQTSPSEAEEDSDVSDVTRWGEFTPVLSEFPQAVGVNHYPRILSVPPHIKRPPYADNDALSGVPGHSLDESVLVLGSDDELKMRKAARLAAETLKYAETLVAPGVTTETIDESIHHFIVSRGAYPSPLGYNHFPRSCCTSVNNVMVHGIPDGRPLEEGDIVNIDITVYIDGFHGDTSRTFPVGSVDEQALSLLRASALALHAGISACGPGAPFKNIGAAITEFTRSSGYSVSAEADGHGIGRAFHMGPRVLHTRNEEPGVMKPGHCFTIEPCIVQGNDARGWILPDGWTMLTETWARAAQMEHTVLITETGVEVLTARPADEM